MKFDSSTFGEDSTGTVDDIFINLKSTTNDILLENWDIKSSIFENTFNLISYPETQSTSKFTIKNVTFSENCIVKNEIMFEILGSVTTADFLID